MRTHYVSTMLRLQTMAEIGGVITFDNVLKAAVARAKRRASARSADLYATWHQHNASKTRVFDEFRGILAELNISTSHSSPLMRELDETWGTGASLYFE